MLGIIRRNRNTINMFTNRTISHRDNKPMNSGLLGKMEENYKSEKQLMTGDTVILLGCS